MPKSPHRAALRSSRFARDRSTAPLKRTARSFDLRSRSVGAAATAVLGSPCLASSFSGCSLRVLALISAPDLSMAGVLVTAARRSHCASFQFTSIHAWSSLRFAGSPDLPLIFGQPLPLRSPGVLLRTGRSSCFATNCRNCSQALIIDLRFCGTSFMYCFALRSSSRGMGGGTARCCCCCCCGMLSGELADSDGWTNASSPRTPSS